MSFPSCPVRPSIAIPTAVAVLTGTAFWAALQWAGTSLHVGMPMPVTGLVAAVVIGYGAFDAATAVVIVAREARDRRRGRRFADQAARFLAEQEQVR